MWLLNAVNEYTHDRTLVHGIELLMYLLSFPNRFTLPFSNELLPFQQFFTRKEDSLSDLSTHLRYS